MSSSLGIRHRRRSGCWGVVAQGSCARGLVSPLSAARSIPNHPQWQKRACKMSAFFPQSAERRVGGWFADSEQQPPDRPSALSFSQAIFIVIFMGNKYRGAHCVKKAV